ncbi:hypothetical protein ACI2UK_24350 [Ralstonia nicotianae]|uniref:hypothetical protein n=1 Tax=Ralstonia pseudosolanacearum TaxID=1310165 RepID=UPI0020029F77|nr:hypothetical protein [Ralstonia pseudosolanacearum]MCK4120426.1 hypothetical protein [Ralstonia pseudosolanacearum]
MDIRDIYRLHEQYSHAPVTIDMGAVDAFTALAPPSRGCASVDGPWRDFWQPTWTLVLMICLACVAGAAGLGLGSVYSKNAHHPARPDELPLIQKTPTASPIATEASGTPATIDSIPTPQATASTSAVMAVASREGIVAPELGMPKAAVAPPPAALDTLSRTDSTSRAHQPQQAPHESAPLNMAPPQPRPAEHQMESAATPRQPTHPLQRSAPAQRKLQPTSPTIEPKPPVGDIKMF